MRYGVFGDIYGNLEALESFLEDASQHGCKKFACTGDLIGFFPDPNACIDLIRSVSCAIVRGDRDQLISDGSEIKVENQVIRHTALWTRGHLSQANKEYLESRPLFHSIENDDHGIVHASLDDPGLFSYLNTKLEAMAHFSFQYWHVAFFGHSNSCDIWRKDSDGNVENLTGEDMVIIGGDAIYAINTGSLTSVIGKDGQGHGSYVIFDTEENTVERRFFEYDIELTHLKIKQSGIMLPGFE